MVFPDRYGVVIEGEKTGGEIALPSPPLRAKEGQTSAFTVPYSYVDLNGHMNNTRYFDLAEDCIPAAAEGRALTRIQTEYVSEARYLETFTVSWGEENGAFFIQGEGEKPVFRMRMEYEAAGGQ